MSSPSFGGGIYLLYKEHTGRYYYGEPETRILHKLFLSEKEGLDWINRHLDAGNLRVFRNYDSFAISKDKNSIYFTRMKGIPIAKQTGKTTIVFCGE